MAEEQNVVVDESAPIGPDGNPVVEEPVAEAEVAEAAEAEGAEEKAESKPAPEGYVPVAVVQEMREELKAVKSRAEQAASLLQQREEREARIRSQHEQDQGVLAAKNAETALAAQIEQELGPCPDATEDPLGARDWQKERRTMLREAKRDVEIADLKKTIQGRDQAQDQGQFTARIQGLTQEFIKENPDYLDAFNYVKAVKQAEAEEMGKDVEPYLESQAKDVVETALRKNQNPAARIYEMAKRYGWQGKAKTEDKPETKPAAKLEKKAEGQKLRSMPAGAAQSASLPTLEEIDKMSWQEGMKWRSDPKNKAYLDELLRNS